MANDEGKAVEFIRAQLIGDQEILEKFEKFVGSAKSVDLNRLFEEVDQTDYSLLDWVEALVGFDEWLADQGIEERPFGEMLGYVHCCTLTTAQTVGSPNLKVIVYQSLTDFGFDAVPDPQF